MYTSQVSHDKKPVPANNVRNNNSNAIPKLIFELFSRTIFHKKEIIFRIVLDEYTLNIFRHYRMDNSRRLELMNIIPWETH